MVNDFYIFIILDANNFLPFHHLCKAWSFIISLFIFKSVIPISLVTRRADIPISLLTPRANIPFPLITQMWGWRWIMSSV